MNELSGSVIELMRRFRLLRPFGWKGPVGRVDRLVVSFPDIVHYFEIDHFRSIENGHTFVLMFGEEIEVRSLGNLVHMVGVPDAIAQLNDGILDQQSYGHVQLDLHLTLQSDEQLTVLLSIAEFLSYFLNI